MIRQYGNSPRITQLMANMDQYLNQDANIEAFYNIVWNIDTAQGFGLDIWGRIVGVSRNIQILSDEERLGFKTGSAIEDYEPFGQGTFYNGSPATQTYTLSDDAFRLLILTRALTNIVATTSPAINQVLHNLFPNRGSCFVNDLGNMIMRYTFLFALEPWELSVLQSAGTLPRPTGVRAQIAVLPEDSFGFTSDCQPWGQGTFIPSGATSYVS